MGGCSLARMISQPDRPDSATANSAARMPTTPAAANLPATGASSRRSWPTAVPELFSSGGGNFRPVLRCRAPVGLRDTSAASGAMMGCPRSPWPGRGGGPGVSGGLVAGRSSCRRHQLVGEFPGLPVVGHQQDGDLAAQGRDVRLTTSADAAVQVRGGLVQQQHRGAGRDPGQPAGQRHPAQLAGAELGGVLRGQVPRGAGREAALGLGHRFGAARRGGPGRGGTDRAPVLEDGGCDHYGVLRHPGQVRRRESAPAGRRLSVPSPAPTVPASTPRMVLLPAPL